MKSQLTAAFVCVHCRKVFKRPSHRLVGQDYETLDYKPRCPQCRTGLIQVGDAFRAPQITDKAGWERVERNLRRGRRYIRDEGAGKRPQPCKQPKMEKGIRSLFQLPARKRR